ncbi:GNAT family N-acetyltransferase [Nonomuraea sp. 3-1Str]|uniref:GNAT family N-acetyltransferase n=1 Tax=Nonomuraea sp. 3-1Str TaxID=2929801 RepID=UPI002856EAD6|nr:GNAT family N-acetyltransferase [Nonomuraea sp. 3-1Str]MDR8409432.1 GNAT family N-acetyltransferase [Nonomuraea sp. 3-1Str]
MTDPPVAPMRFRLDVRLPQAVPAHDFRHPGEADISALGRLMWEAYRGTPDEEDAGGSVGAATEEIRLTLTGEHGIFLPTASFVADDGARPVAAALVTEWQQVPLLAYVFTAPSHAGEGLGRRLIEAAMHALGEQGYRLLSLAVTEANVRARRLYASMGFTPHS